MEMEEGQNIFIDEALLPLSDFLLSLADLGFDIDEGDILQYLYLESLSLDLPMDIDISMNDEEEILIGGGTPVHRTETSFRPNYHRLKLNMQINNEPERE
jgi:hypothetical protein